MRSKKGFTLIEMLVVIAIIAVLVAIIVPTVTSSTTKAKAAVDAANLRTIRGSANTVLVGDDLAAALSRANSDKTASVSFPNAKIYMAYSEPAFVKIYFVDDGKYYDIDYFSDVASTGKSSRSTGKPEIDGATWYNITDGGIAV